MHNFDPLLLKHLITFWLCWVLQCLPNYNNKIMYPKMHWCPVYDWWEIMVWLAKKWQIWALGKWHCWSSQFGSTKWHFSIWQYCSKGAHLRPESHYWRKNWINIFLKASGPGFKAGSGTAFTRWTTTTKSRGLTATAATPTTTASWPSKTAFSLQPLMMSFGIKKRQNWTT